MSLQKYLYRMVHIANIPHILEKGLTHKNSVHHNPNYVPIGDQTLIATRRRIILSEGSAFLGDYLPFYFGTRTPMLYIIQKGFNNVPVVSAENIVYCVTSIEAVINSNLEFIFTDGHAAARLTKFYTIKDVKDIAQLVNFNAVNAWYWNEHPDEQRQKSAEFLVKGDIPIDKVLGFAVYNESVKRELIKMGVKSKMIGVRPNYYY